MIDTPARRRIGTANLILAGLALGVVCGLFFGEAMRSLEFVADAYIRLLQMAVLPYITVSLTAAIGRLTPREARFVAGTGGGVLAALWGLMLVLVVAMPLAFPDVQHRGFFSSSTVEPQQGFDLMNLYIPANPFRSLSDNVVPAVVLFCIALGVALMGVPGREQLVGLLDVATQAFGRVNDFIVRLTPIGVFAIAATAAGTLGLEELQRIEVYLVSYVVLACFATFWLLPALVGAVTPVSRRDLVRSTRETLVTAFSTGSLLLVLPSLARTSHELVARLGGDEEETRATVDVLVPVSFNFPHAGKVLTLGFVLFAAWFAGTPLGVADLPKFAAAGLLSIFGSVNVALPFLLDSFKLPADLFQLFLAVSVVNFRFQTLVAAMYTLVLTVLGACAVQGRLAIRPGPLLRFALVSIALLAITLGGTRFFFDHTLPHTGPQDALVRRRTLLADPVSATVYRAAPPPPAGAAATVLERIAATKTLRVGYDPDRLPFSYFNDRDQLVGLDVDMVHRLARELGVALVFVPTDRGRLAAQLDAGEIDLAIGGIEVTTDLARRVALSSPYLQLTMALVVEDGRRGEFGTREALRAHQGLRIGIVSDGYYESKLRVYLPTAEVVRIESQKEFFEGGGLGLDALVDAAEVGAAWSLLYPKYTVVVPQPDHLEAPVAYAVARGRNEFRVFLNTWLLLKREDRTIERLQRYWMLGLDDRPRPPRWSVVRDVLHWVE